MFSIPTSKEGLGKIPMFWLAGNFSQTCFILAFGALFPQKKNSTKRGPHGRAPTVFSFAIFPLRNTETNVGASAAASRSVAHRRTRGPTAGGPRRHPRIRIRGPINHSLPPRPRAIPRDPSRRILPGRPRSLPRDVARDIRHQHIRRN